MAQATVVRPDRKFLEEIVAAGGGDLKKCFQCATCSVVCGLSDAGSPFPRKEMLWAQWGLKDRLLSDPDVWLCHQCNDCSIRCPRGARPGDVLAAVRQKVIQHFAFPSAMGRWVNSPRALPLVLVLLPVVLLAGALGIRGPVEAAVGYVDPHGHEFYAHFFPHWLLIVFYSSLTLLTFAGLLVGLVRFWNGMQGMDRALGSRTVRTSFWTAVWGALKEVFTHVRFGKCTDQAARRTNHLLAFYGFVALFVVTLWATADLYLWPHVLGDAFPQYPFGLLHPMKILANLGGVLLVVGTFRAMMARWKAPQDGRHRSTSFDWVFLWLLFAVGVTGFVVEIFRFLAEARYGDTAYASPMAPPAYAFYFIHLVAVFGLLVYLPYSKFAHLWYRLVAMIYAHQTGRNDGVRPRERTVTGTA